MSFRRFTIVTLASASARMYHPIGISLDALRPLPRFPYALTLTALPVLELYKLIMYAGSDSTFHVLLPPLFEDAVRARTRTVSDGCWDPYLLTDASLYIPPNCDICLRMRSMPLWPRPIARCSRRLRWNHRELRRGRFCGN